MSQGQKQANRVIEEADWAAFRQEMPVSQRWAYLDHAAVAPLCRPAQRAIEAWVTEAAEEGDSVWPRWAGQVERVRPLAAELIGADSNEMALVPNTTTGISLVAEGFPWQEGDNVVTLANEFPANQYPWLNLASRGVETRRVSVEGGRVDLNRVAEACDERTRIVSLSWVGFASGWRMDPAEAAKMVHDQGALFLLDAIQGLGVFPLDVHEAGIDFLAADGHKWMLGPEGAGLLMIRKEHLATLRPVGVGWNSVVGRYAFDKIDFTLRDEAARYEGGSQNMVGFIGLGASLSLLRDAGWNAKGDAIAKRVLSLTDFACRRLEEVGAKIESPRDEGHTSGIVSFTLPNIDPEEARQRCFDEGIALACRAGRLRISPHGYNNEEDVERLVEVLM